MNRQTQSRLAEEGRAQMTLIQLMCAVSIWRTHMTRVLPLAGAAAWWVGIVCLIPGFATAVLFRWLMHATGTSTIQEAVRNALGQWGSILFSVMLAMLLVLDGVASVTALVTMFTEGVGTSGTQLTLAILTGAALLFSMHREGLARGAYLLRWGMLAAILLLVLVMFGEAKMDNLFPLYGDGRASILAAGKAGVSMAWPVMLLFTVEPIPGRGRLCCSVAPCFGAVGAVLLLTLSIPHELLSQHQGLAAMLLLPTQYISNGLRVIALSLLMLAFFLGIGGCTQMIVQQLCAPWQHAPAWLPYILLAALFLTQAMNISTLWTWLGWLEPWLLLPLAAIGAAALPMAWIRRRKA